MGRSSYSGRGRFKGAASQSKKQKKGLRKAQKALKSKERKKR